MEGFKHKWEDKKEELTDALYAEAAKKLSREIPTRGFRAIGEKILEGGKIKPVYHLEETDPVAFQEGRKRLNTERGLIIANHPGYCDTFVILNALERKDLKIVMSDVNFKVISAAIGSEYLLNARLKPTDALPFLKTIKDHIENGGVVLIYPTGGRDEFDIEDKEPFTFESGLSVILKKCLKPEDMVYSFYIEPADVKVISGKKNRLVGAASETALNPLLNINNFRPEVKVRTDERYSTAAEWQGIVNDSTKEDKNQRLADHFIDSFKSTDKQTN